jgi:hypothetical protein
MLLLLSFGLLVLPRVASEDRYCETAKPPLALPSCTVGSVVFHSLRRFDLLGFRYPAFQASIKSSTACVPTTSSQSAP